MRDLAPTPGQLLTPEWSLCVGLSGHTLPTMAEDSQKKKGGREGRRERENRENKKDFFLL